MVDAGPEPMYEEKMRVPPPGLKPPWSVCQKVVNTGQYECEWSIENFKWSF